MVNGVLTLHIPVPEARKPRRIEIATGGAQPALELGATDSADEAREPTSGAA